MKNWRFITVAALGLFLAIGSVQSWARAQEPETEPSTQNEELATLQQQMQELARQIRERVQGEAWQEQLRDLERITEAVEKTFNSPQWQQQMDQLQQQITERFQSAEWKERVKRLEEQAEEIGRRLEEKFSDPEWKNRMLELEQKMQDLGRRLQARPGTKQ